MVSGSTQIDPIAKRTDPAPSFNGQDLRGQDFTGADLREARLLGADLRGCSLRGANLTGAKLVGANLEDADLTDCSAPSAIFGEANLTHAVLFGANLTNASFTAATMTGADLRAANLEHARLIDADLSGADFSGATLSRADLSEANVTNALFKDADLGNSTLIHLTGFQRADWIGVSLADIDFSGAYLLRREIMDQNYLYEFRTRDRRHAVLYTLWKATSDCGRSLVRWGAMTVMLALLFGVLYTMVDLDYGSNQTALSPFYFSVVTITTLGYGDVLPASLAAQALVMIQVALGYMMLGGVLSIFATRMGRRAD